LLPIPTLGGTGCVSQGPRRGRGPSLGIQTLRPYSPLGISKLMRRVVENYPASPRRSSAVLAFFPCIHHGPRAESRRGAVPYSDHDSRHVEVRVPDAHAHTRNCRTAAESWTIEEWRTTVATKQGSTSTTTISWFLPSCKLQPPINCFTSCPGPRYFFPCLFFNQINYLYSILDF
jgi:hypothetical protein